MEVGNEEVSNKLGKSICASVHIEVAELPQHMASLT